RNMGECKTARNNGITRWDQPGSPFAGTSRVLSWNQPILTNEGGPEVIYTDPFGKGGQTEPFPGSIRQYFASINNGGRQLGGPRISANYMPPGVRAPNGAHWSQYRRSRSSAPFSALPGHGPSERSPGRCSRVSLDISAYGPWCPSPGPSGSGASQLPQHRATRSHRQGSTTCRCSTDFRWRDECTPARARFSRPSQGPT